MSKIEMKVEGISCGLCAITIEGALKEIGCSGKVNLESATLAVEFDENNVSLEKIKEVIEEYGYKLFQKADAQ